MPAACWEANCWAWYDVLPEYTSLATIPAKSLAAAVAGTSAPGGAAVADALQVDAPLREGEAGGPLLDTSGRVTGVNTQMVTAAGDTVDLAIPVNTVRRMLPQLSGKAMKVVSG